MARKVIVRRHLSLPDREREALRAEVEREFSIREEQLRWQLNETARLVERQKDDIDALNHIITALRQRLHHNDSEENTYASTKEEYFLAWLEKRGWRLEREDNFYKRTVVYYLFDKKTGIECKSWEFTREDIEDFPEAIERTIQSWVEKEERASRGEFF